MNPADFIITDPTQMPYYCPLCQVSSASQIDYDKHLIGMKHISKASPKAENMTLTDSTQMPNYCSLCQISCSSQDDFKKHLVGMKHTYNNAIMEGLNDDTKDKTPEGRP